ncbi:transcriptional regulator [Solibacillus sp. R5-41]|uniref:transcriptional regulator n=1 Tax=Solibacillus sp. R5-41 TaxID=2048654 RepID=UPI000C1271D3|nr:transcriptional regulator [Solibacillus sp. R5-41]ATP40258.1 transcriptional regulator [Solibacillus sp. R5-41]
MNDYRSGYEYYKRACENFGLEPINFHYYILNLSQEQLDAYNCRATENRGNYVLATS